MCVFLIGLIKRVCSDLLAKCSALYCKKKYHPFSCWSFFHGKKGIIKKLCRKRWTFFSSWLLPWYKVSVPVWYSLNFKTWEVKTAASFLRGHVFQVYWTLTTPNHINTAAQSAFSVLFNSPVLCSLPSFKKRQSAYMILWHLFFWMKT